MQEIVLYFSCSFTFSGFILSLGNWLQDLLYKLQLVLYCKNDITLLNFDPEFALYSDGNPSSFGKDVCMGTTTFLLWYSTFDPF